MDVFQKLISRLRLVGAPKRAKGSKYMPHQGEREKLRRRVGGFHRVRESDAWLQWPSRKVG